MAEARLPRRRRRSRGAVIIEFTLVAGILIGLLAAAVDFGFGWRRSIEVSSTLRGGARIISTLGDARQADQEALRAINAGILEMGSASVTKVIVFKSTTTNGAVPANCLTVTPSASGAGRSGSCNVYGPAQFAALASSSARFSGSTTSCQSDDWDQYYCPTSREDVQGAGTDYVGIYMEFTTDWIFGFLPGDGRRGDDTVVYRIEPTG